MAVVFSRKRFTADQYQRMGEVGILSENDRVELIDGEVVAKMTIGPRHNACVSSGNHALVRAAGDSAIVLPQGSVRLDLYNEPEPDLVLLRPRADYYASRHAGPQDILLIIEVAQSALEYDREIKGMLYAMAQIPEYWIVDLSTNVLARYLEPHGDSYRSRELYRRGQSIAPALLPSCVVAVDALLIE